MLGVGPVEAFLGHAQGNNNIYPVPVLGDNGGEVVEDPGALSQVAIVYQVSDFEGAAVVFPAHGEHPGCLVHGFDRADGIQHPVDFLVLVFGGFRGAHVRYVQDGFLVRVEDFF